MCFVFVFPLYGRLQPPALTYSTAGRVEAIFLCCIPIVFETTKTNTIETKALLLYQSSFSHPTPPPSQQ